MTMLPKLQNANICELILKLRVWTFARLNFYSEFMKSCSLTQKNKVQSRVNRGRDSKQTRKSDSRKTQWIIASKKQRTTHKRLDLQELLIEIPNLTHCNQVYRASIMSILLCCHVVLFLFFWFKYLLIFSLTGSSYFEKKSMNVCGHVWPRSLKIDSDLSRSPNCVGQGTMSLLTSSSHLMTIPILHTQMSWPATNCCIDHLHWVGVLAFAD
jgi:hypothetical protein